MQGACDNFMQVSWQDCTNLEWVQQGNNILHPQEQEEFQRRPRFLGENEVMHLVSQWLEPYLLSAGKTPKLNESDCIVTSINSFDLTIIEVINVPPNRNSSDGIPSLSETLPQHMVGRDPPPYSLAGLFGNVAFQRRSENIIHFPPKLWMLLASFQWGIQTQTALSSYCWFSHSKTIS